MLNNKLYVIIDVPEDIDVNKTSASSEFFIFQY